MRLVTSAIFRHIDFSYQEHEQQCREEDPVQQLEHLVRGHGIYLAPRATRHAMRVIIMTPPAAIATRKRVENARVNHLVRGMMTTSAMR